MSDSDYLKDAFSIAAEEEEIVPITLKKGEEGYRVNPEFHERVGRRNGSGWKI